MRALIAALMLAAAAPAALAAGCDGDDFATVLAPRVSGLGDDGEASRSGPPDLTNGVAHARAVWLDRRRLRWPGIERTGRFRLRHSAGVLDLSLHDGALPDAVSKRFSWVGDGATLELAADDRRLRELHRGPLVLVREDDGGRVLDATGTQIAGALDDLYAAAADAPGLGVAPGAAHTDFGLWAPTARSVSLCLYGGARSPAEAEQPMRREETTGIWRLRVEGDLSGRYYAFRVDVAVPGVGLVRNRVTDPYSLSLSADSRRSYVADPDAPSLKPEGWDDALRPPMPAAATDLVIYELHVRDFSASDASVRPGHRGKYLAFTAPRSRGMRHLRALAQAGVTDVHLLPVFDIASIPERGCVTPAIDGPPDGERQQAIVAAHKERDCYNWGYDPFHYTAPEGSYATNADDGAARIREFRRMVMALHAAGLRVGMDVVYNHTSAAGQARTSVLDRIVPGYYQRLDADGAVATSTCCANTATENAMMARLMIDSAVAWVRHYRIDSFRFDLMGHQPRAAMARLQTAVDAAAGRHIHLLGEGWNFGEIADSARFVQASQQSLNGSGIATFSDRARDAVRGGGCCDTGAEQVIAQGWLNGLHYAPNALAGDRHPLDALMRQADLVRVGLAGSLRSYRLRTHGGTTLPLERIDYKGQPAGYVSEPGEVVNYVENHDNPTLFDVNVLKLPADTSAEDRARVQVLGAAVVAFSQGIAYLHAGMEILRSKSLDRNSYDSGDWFNRLDWRLRDNHFGIGLPPAWDNEASWPWMQPRLAAAAAIKPAPAQMRWTRDAVLDLLRIRAGSTLFRLRTADDVRQRLSFPNTGPNQVPTVLVGHLDGRGYPGAGFGAVLYFLNADVRPHTLALPAFTGQDWRLHPVQRSARSADRRARRESAYEAASGRFTIPPRTAIVYVQP